MRIDEILYLKPGDTVYNCFMDKMTIKSIISSSLNDENNKSQLQIIMTNNEVYDIDNIYLENLDDESDEEKAWINWAKDNRDFFETFDHINVLKSVYKTAFAHGFEHKKTTRLEEILQK